MWSNLVALLFWSNYFNIFKARLIIHSFTLPSRKNKSLNDVFFFVISKDILLKEVFGRTQISLCKFFLPVSSNVKNKRNYTSNLQPNTKKTTYLATFFLFPSLNSFSQRDLMVPSLLQRPAYKIFQKDIEFKFANVIGRSNAKGKNCLQAEKDTNVSIDTKRVIVDSHNEKLNRNVTFLNTTKTVLDVDFDGGVVTEDHQKHFSIELKDLIDRACTILPPLLFWLSSVKFDEIVEAHMDYFGNLNQFNFNNNFALPEKTYKASHYPQKSAKKFHTFVDKLHGQVLEEHERQHYKRQLKQAQNLSHIFSSLGPTFIKIGQALSNRPDLIGPIYAHELEKLQDQVNPYDSQTAMRIIEKELRLEKLEDLFDFVNLDEEKFTNKEKSPSSTYPKPVASASLGQVYKARLKNTNEIVAVKVQRPNAQYLAKLDIQLLSSIASIIKTLFPSLIRTDLVAVIKQIGNALQEELDYEQEALNCLEFGYLYGNMKGVKIPKVYLKYTTPKVITMEWINGDKLPWGADSKKLIDLGLKCSVKQLLDYGFMHADPHPGNLLRSTANRDLAYLDFGMMAYITNEDRLQLMKAVGQLFNEDFSGLARTMMKMGFVSSDSNLSNSSLNFHSLANKANIPKFGTAKKKNDKTESKINEIDEVELGKALAVEFRSSAKQEVNPKKNNKRNSGQNAKEKKYLHQDNIIKNPENINNEDTNGNNLMNLSFIRLASNLKSVSNQFPIQIPPSWSLVIRCLGILEGIALGVDPEFKVVKGVYPYILKHLLFPNEDTFFPDGDSAIITADFRHHSISYDMEVRRQAKRARYHEYDTIIEDILLEEGTNWNGKRILRIRWDRLEAIVNAAFFNNNQSRNGRHEKRGQHYRESRKEDNHDKSINDSKTKNNGNKIIIEIAEFLLSEGGYRLRRPLVEDVIDSIFDLELLGLEFMEDLIKELIGIGLSPASINSFTSGVGDLKEKYQDINSEEEKNSNSAKANINFLQDLLEASFLSLMELVSEGSTNFFETDYEVQVDSTDSQSNASKFSTERLWTVLEGIFSRSLTNVNKTIFYLIQNNQKMQGNSSARLNMLARAMTSRNVAPLAVNRWFLALDDEKQKVLLDILRMIIAGYIERKSITLIRSIFDSLQAETSLKG